jgi:alpha-D-xyloside xylohydrolase
MMIRLKTMIYIIPLLAGVYEGAVAQAYRQMNHGVQLTVDSMNITIRFFTSDIVRILKSPVGVTVDKQSFAVVKQPERVHFTMKRTGSILNIIGDSLEVHVNLKNGQIAFFNPSRARLLSEKANGRHFTPCRDSSEHAFRVTQSFQLTPEESIYGLGQHQTGKMNQRGQTLLLKQRNRDIAIPYFYSTKGYGLFWDNTSTTIFKDTTFSTSFVSMVGDCIDYYFIKSENADQGVALWRELTGQAPMFPRWAFGYWQSRERYKSQRQLLGVVEKYRSLKVPLDVIVQDWQYWGTDDKQWNSTKFGNPGYPHPRQMVDSVHALHVHIVISVWPSFGEHTQIYKVMQKDGYLFDLITWPPTPLVRVYDAFSPKARDIYWDFINRDLFALGIDGWWLDSTEPDQIKPKKSDNDNRTYAGLFGKVRNAFPIETVGGVYLHQRKETSQKRVVILARSAYAGQQRDASAVWSGDTRSDWKTLHAQITSGLNMSFSGIPYWTCDIGGFFSHGNYPRGVLDPAFQELYVRWLEFGTFCPIMRSHGTDTPREIFAFGKKGDWAFDAIAKFINLRYRLMPYIYSTAWKVTSQASTIMRPLVMDFPKDKKVNNLTGEYLFGRSFLVCPVTQPCYTRQVTKDSTVTDFGELKTWNVYLPRGTGWYDFWTGVQLPGGQQITRKVPIDIMPLYVRAGAVVPMGPFEQYTGQKADSVLYIRIYPGADGDYTLYEDENDNDDYEKGIYATITFSWNDKSHTLVIGNRKGRFPGMLDKRTFHIVLVGKSHGSGIGIDPDPDKIVRYDGSTRTIRF